MLNLPWFSHVLFLARALYHAARDQLHGTLA